MKTIQEKLDIPYGVKADKGQKAAINESVLDMRHLLYLLLFIPVLINAQPGTPDANGVITAGPPWVTGVQQGDGELKLQLTYLNAAILLNDAEIAVIEDSITDISARSLVNSTQIKDSIGDFNVTSTHGGVPGAISGDDLDDAAAINATIVAAWEDVDPSMNTVYIPPGEWDIESPIYIRNRVHIDVKQGANFDFPDNYSGAMWSTDSVNLGSPNRNGYIERASVSGGYYRGDGHICSWNLIDLRANDSDSSRQVFCYFENMMVRDCNIGINTEITNDGWINGNLFRNIILINPKSGIRARGGTAGVGFEFNTFDNIQIQHGDSTEIGLDSLEQGRANTFRDIVYWDFGTTQRAVLGEDFDGNFFIGQGASELNYWADSGSNNNYFGANEHVSEVLLSSLVAGDGIATDDYISQPWDYDYKGPITITYTGSSDVTITATPPIEFPPVNGRIINFISYSKEVTFPNGTGIQFADDVATTVKASQCVTLVYEDNGNHWKEISRSYPEWRRIELTPSAAAATYEGTIYYDSDDDHFYGHNASGWVQLDN